MSSEAAQYIGSRISLTTKSQIRYEGMLFALDHSACTVSLEQVRCMGTEGRNNGIREIAPSSTIYEMIVFRASDIIDLKIDHSKAIHDPAIISTATKSAPTKEAPESHPRMGPAAKSNGETATLASSSSLIFIDPAPVDSPPTELKPARTYEANQTAKTPSEEPQKQQPVFRLTRAPSANNTTPKSQERRRKAGFPREFDVERANHRFELIKVKSKPSSPQSGYDASTSFFDTLSTASPSTAKPQMKNETRLNVKTFGPVAYNTKPLYSGSGRGRPKQLQSKNTNPMQRSKGKNISSTIDS